MNTFIKPISIKELKTVSSLVHGISPKYFETASGEKNLLLLGQKNSDGASPQHREWFLRALDIESDEVFLVKQIHSDRVYVLDNPSMSDDALAAIEADAIITHMTGKPIGVLTADCIPIIIYDTRLHVVGTIHAGRKGTAENILSKTVEALRNAYGSRPENILMGMGPGIGGCCYEVDDPCVQPFRQKYRGWTSFVTQSPGNKYRLDLFRANEEDGLNAGILRGNIFRSGECTSCLNEQFFSYRREGKTGRILTLAMLRPRG